MTPGPLPDWAEAVLRALAPVPAYGASTQDAAAVERYRQIEARIRCRWQAELQPHVWGLFRGHDEQAATLLALMIDMARHGSMSEFAAKRQGLEDMARIEDEVRAACDTIMRKAEALARLEQRLSAVSGLDTDAVRALRNAAACIAQQSWREPALSHADHATAISSRKTQRDALIAMLALLDLYADQLQPVELTDVARATIYNVVHDAGDDAAYSAPAVKKARADMRRRR